MITATVDKNSIKIDHEELMTSGSVKTNFIQFVFSEDWNGLTKTAIFQTKKISIPVIVDGEDKVAIPWEAMAFPKEEIKFGVYGVRFDDESTEDVDEEIVLPTIWGSLGKVVEGVLVECPPITEPTKDAYLQLLDYIKNLQPGGGGGGVDERVSDGTLFVSSMDTEPTVGLEYPVSYKNFIGLKPSNAATYLGLLTVGNDFYISSVTVTAIDNESNDIQVRFDSLTKLTDVQEAAGGTPYVDQLVAPPDTYSAHDVETLIGKSLYYLTWSGDPMKVAGTLEVSKEFTAYFLYDGEQLNPTLNYYGVFVCDEYDPVSTERIKATLKNATLIGNRTESLNSFLTFFKLDEIPQLNVTTSIPYKSAVGVLPQWMNTAHRGLMTVGNELYLIDFRLEWLDHDNEAFKIKFTAIYPISNSGADGKDYLVFNGTLTTEPTVGRVTVDNAGFNRTPVANEPFSGVAIFDGITYYIHGIVINMSDSRSTVELDTVTKLTGENGSNEDSFVTFKDLTITTPSELETAIGHRPYYGCIHAINTRILGVIFTNDIVWISYRLISGTYYLDLVTADGHCEAWSSDRFSAAFSSISSTKFLLEDELDLAEGTTFIGYFITPPEVGSTTSVQPDWFIGKKPIVGEQYEGRFRTPEYKWYNMVANVVGTLDHDGTTMFTVEIVRVYEADGGGAELTAGDGLTITDGVASVDTPVQGIFTQSEYNALPDDKKNNGLYVISDSGSGSGGGSNGGDSLDVYSTEEKRIGTWIDGKPVYQRTWTAYTATKPNIWTESGIVISDLDHLIDYRGILLENVSNIETVIPYFETATTYANLNYWRGFENLNGFCTYCHHSSGSYFYNAKFTVTARYTKTTDEPEVTT